MSGISKYHKEICMGLYGGDPKEFHFMYCMDGRIGNETGRDVVPSMQKYAGFSSFPCCDFCILREGKIVLVEATQMPRIREIHSIKKECMEKLYGSIAMLERMARLCSDFAKKVGERPKYVFWLVLHGYQSKRGLRGLPALKGLIGKIPGALDKNIVSDVDVIIGIHLGKKIQEIDFS